MKMITNTVNNKIFRKNNKAFTLVELIVVLIILALLAAILIPSLIGYIDKAKNGKYLSNAKPAKMRHRPSSWNSTE